MTRLVFLDTETTGVHPDRRVWEIGMIAREAGRADREYHAYIRRDELDLGNADQRALAVGRFYDRHPQMLPEFSGPDRLLTEGEAMEWVEQVTRGAVLVGVNIQFDADVLAQRMRFWGYAPAWHYDLVEIKALAVGWLVGAGYTVAPPPWKVHTVSAWLNLPPQVAGDDLHTALGDARHVRAMWDAVAERQAPAEDEAAPAEAPRVQSTS